MSLHYAWEKLSGAVHYMASTDESLQKRLEQAFIGGLHIINPAQDLPEDLRGEWNEIRDAVTCKPAPGKEGTIAATCSQLSNEEASKLIQRIVSVYSSVVLASGREDAKHETP